ncbi:hypothetical protein BDZ89DRAFT_1064905 [Hymenopellis radicata]|nr:hypothetical protein BDZ89DRAFT_1064905 [Hymenopellis radicata]
MREEVRGEEDTGMTSEVAHRRRIKWMEKWKGAGAARKNAGRGMSWWEAWPRSACRENFRCRSSLHHKSRHTALEAHSPVGRMALVDF